MKNQRGITLVALVITIIVLLILAGVSISLVIGNNGVLTQASSSVLTNNVAAVKEDLSVALAACETKYYTEWAQNSATRRSTVYTENISSELAVKGLTISSTSVVGDSATDFTITKTATGETYKFTFIVNDLTGEYNLGNSVEYTAQGRDATTINV